MEVPLLKYGVRSPRLLRQSELRPAPGGPSLPSFGPPLPRGVGGHSHAEDSNDKMYFTSLLVPHVAATAIPRNAVPVNVRYYFTSEPLRHPKRPGQSLASCQLIHTAITAGTSRVALGPHCLHAVANTPAGLMEFVRSYDSIRFGLPTTRGGSAPALSVSGPAQRSLTLRPACSPGRHCDPLHQGFSSSRCLHCCSDCYRVERTSSRAGIPPLWTTAFSRRTRVGDYTGRWTERSRLPTTSLLIRNNFAILVVFARCRLFLYIFGAKFFAAA